MKHFVMCIVALCAMVTVTSCKSSESAYKKAYEKAKLQETAQTESAEVVEVTPVVTTPVVTAPVATPVSAPITFREEKVSVVLGNGLKDFSVVCGSFGVKTNAESLKEFLDKEGYSAIIVQNPDTQMYRVIVATFDDKESAAAARDAFKEKYTDRQDFQGSWLLYRLAN